MPDRIVSRHSPTVTSLVHFALGGVVYGYEVLPPSPLFFKIHGKI